MGAWKSAEGNVSHFSQSPIIAILFENRTSEKAFTQYHLFIWEPADKFFELKEKLSAW